MGTFKKKYGLMLISFGITLIVLMLRFITEHFGLTIIPLNGLITAFLSGVFFTIGLLFAGAMSDFKEAEKIPGEIAVAIKTIYTEADILVVQDRKLTENVKKHAVDLLHTINSNFKRNVWKLKEINGSITKLNQDIKELNKVGVPPQFIARLRNELAVIDKYAHRIDVIEETTFIPAAYTIAEVAIGVAILLLLFLKSDILLGGYVLVGVITLVLVSLLALIRDIDNPFEYGIGTYADVDLTILFNLEKHLKKPKE